MDCVRLHSRGSQVTHDVTRKMQVPVHTIRKPSLIQTSLTASIIYPNSLFLLCSYLKDKVSNERLFDAVNVVR